MIESINSQDTIIHSATYCHALGYQTISCATIFFQSSEKYFLDHRNFQIIQLIYHIPYAEIRASFSLCHLLEVELATSRAGLVELI